MHVGTGTYGFAYVYTPYLMGGLGASNYLQHPSPTPLYGAAAQQAGQLHLVSLGNHSVSG